MGQATRDEWIRSSSQGTKGWFASSALTELDQGDRLLSLIGQHNTKEQLMLYPMAQQVPGEHQEALSAKVTALT